MFWGRALLDSPLLLNQAGVTMGVQTNLAAAPSLPSPSQSSTLSFPKNGPS